MNRKNDQRRRRTVATNSPTQAKQVFSYHSKRNKSDQILRDSETIRSNNKASKLRDVFVALLSLVMFLLVVSYISTLNSNTKVYFDKDPSKQTQIRPVQEYKNEINKIFADSWLNKLKFAINTKEVESKIKERFPELNSATVLLSILDRSPKIVLSGNEPKLIIVEGSNRYIVDKNGKVIMESDGQGSSSTLPIVTDEANIEIQPGKSALTSQEVQFITEVYRQFEAKKYQVESATISSGTNALNVNLKGKRYVIKLDRTNDPIQSSGAAMAVLKRLEKQKIVPEKYIDARVEDKVYYR